ncbi:hypothetical protein HOY82DRAFT_536820 [Tuber indicum]|nr:hypothetical protein HOY82DRAFT_536820 [Tuber indicum]
MADRYPEHPNLAIFDFIESNPPQSLQEPDIGPDDSEEEIELENGGYVESRDEDEEVDEDESEGEIQDENDARLGTASVLLNRELPNPPQFTPFTHHAPEHAREAMLPPGFPEEFLMMADDDRLVCTSSDPMAGEGTENPIQLEKAA